MAKTDQAIDGSGGAQRALRSIAAFEAIKGVLAIAAGFGVLSLLHHDLHHIAASLIGRIGLDPGGHYPATILSDLDRLQATDSRVLIAVTVVYAVVRFSEAYGLWRARRWGEWLGALSGALYVPFELRHLLHSPSVTATLVVVFNVAVVAFLATQLRAERGRKHATTGG